MKKILSLGVCFVFIFQVARAQEETLISDLSFTGAFGGPILEFSQINGQLTADVGGGGALILFGLAALYTAAG